MTDDLPFPEPLTPQTSWATPRCARHRWGQNVLPGDPLDLVRCRRCHHVQDAARVKAGRNSRARGGRHELAASRLYGGRKVGPLGGPADIVGTLFSIQVKTHAGPAPVRLLRLLEAMDGGGGGRVPVVLDRYLRPGQSPVDLFTIRGADWIALHGKDGTE